MSNFDALYFVMLILGFILGACLLLISMAVSRDVKILEETQTIVDKEYLSRLEKFVYEVNKKKSVVEEDDFN